jgi:hypothetical protein
MVRVRIAASILLAGACVAGCSSSGAKSSASPGTSSQQLSTASSTETAPSVASASSVTSPASAGGSTATGSAAAVTFDGAYSGTMKIMNCVGTGPTTTVSVTMVFDGVASTSYTGNISSTELGWEGPDNTDYDSGFLNTPLDTDGKGFDLDGIKVKNEDGKVVTLHGTLHCP